MTLSVTESVPRVFGPFLWFTFLHLYQNSSYNSWFFTSIFWYPTRLIPKNAAAAAKSLQLCSTLCDPIDGSPPGSPVPGILRARTLEWVAISFSKAWKWKVKVKALSRVRLLATPWTAAHQAPPSMGFSRQEYWHYEFNNTWESQILSADNVTMDNALCFFVSIQITISVISF